MDMLTFPGKAWYSLTSFIVLMGSLSVSFFLLLGSFSGSISVGYAATFILGNLATLGLLLGVMWSFSKNKTIVAITFLSSAFLPCQAVFSFMLLYGKTDIAFTGRLPYAYLALVLINVILMMFAYNKFMQLRKLR